MTTRELNIHLNKPLYKVTLFSNACSITVGRGSASERERQVECPGLKNGGSLLLHLPHAPRRLCHVKLMRSPFGNTV